MASDHCLVLLNFLKENLKSNKIIGYEEFWASYPVAKGIIKSTWSNNPKGNFIELLNNKFKRTLKALYYLSKSRHKKYEIQREYLKKEIKDLQMKEAEKGWLLDKDRWCLNTKVTELNSILARLNSWWKQRAKINLLSDMDSNSTFYHSFDFDRRWKRKSRLTKFF